MKRCVFIDIVVTSGENPIMVEVKSETFQRSSNSHEKKIQCMKLEITSMVMEAKVHLQKGLKRFTNPNPANNKLECYDKN